MNENIVTIAACLKNHGYATGQFGENHLGDLNRMLPTNHGFDEFFGNLYHLNAEEEAGTAGLPQREGFPELPKNVRAARHRCILGRRALTRSDRGTTLG